MGAPLFFLTAAEHSGDALGASLIAALRKIYPEARFMGVGGEKMREAGCVLLDEPVSRSAMLVGAFFTQSWYWFKLLRRIRGELVRHKPDVVIPIDSSAINLRIAGVAREAGLKVCYLVAPQVWASRPGRIKKIRARVDTLCCLLPFEEEYFASRGIRAVYVGHPMFDTPAETAGSDPEKVVPALPGGAESRGFRVAVFPGSRRAEIARHMGPLREIVAEIRRRFPQACFVAVAPSEERAREMRGFLGEGEMEVRVGQADAVIRWSDLVIAKSGTITLQIAKQAKPMVVIFAVPGWQWAVGKRFILTPYIALVNILAGREVVPEFIPLPASPLVVAGACGELLRDAAKRAAMAGELRKVIEPLWPPGTELGAADRAAAEVAKLVDTKRI